MEINPKLLVHYLAKLTGFNFEIESTVDVDNRKVYSISPRGYSKKHTFSVHIILDWRRVNLTFELGKFAAELLTEISKVDEIGRNLFSKILSDCENNGAKVDLMLNNQKFEVHDNAIWNQEWNQFELILSKGQLPLGTNDSQADLIIINEWTGKFVQAIIALLPLEDSIPNNSSEISGYPEGALKVMKVNRYERNLKNKVNAILIHGNHCHACGVDLSQLYGEIATGCIEIHHKVKVSELGENYVINPTNDLVPLCPNCHTVTHQRHPPFTVDEIKKMLEQNK